MDLEPSYGPSSSCGRVSSRGCPRPGHRAIGPPPKKNWGSLPPPYAQTPRATPTPRPRQRPCVAGGLCGLRAGGHAVHLPPALKHGGGAHARADAHAHHAKAGGRAPALHLVQQSGGGARPRGAQGVAHGDRAAVGVHLGVVDAQVLYAEGGLQGRRGEGGERARSCTTHCRDTAAHLGEGAGKGGWDVCGRVPTFHVMRVIP